MEDKETTLLQSETDELVKWAADIDRSDASAFEKAREKTAKLGAHYSEGITTVGFWVPELTAVDDLFLEIFYPREQVRFRVDEQQIHFHYERVPIVKQGEYCWGIYDGLKAGDKENFGCFYRLGYRHNSSIDYVYDPMAHSLPFGAFAPAELYDIEKAHRDRKDLPYFQRIAERGSHDESTRVAPATNMLEIHVGTASKRGTFRGLTNKFKEIAYKIEHGKELSPDEQLFAGYDGIQLMPIEPVIENPDEKPFWKIFNSLDEETGELSVLLRHPNMINWGYDILIFGSAAINPTMLETGRPDEFIEFLEVMHNFPGKPIKVTIDIVFGHSDNQGKLLLNNHFFKGDNMYGQDIDYSHPVVRAILLEMQHRKMNWGIDAIRIDGAQDFKHYDKEHDELVHDDDFLTSMSYVAQQVAGHSYYPWMIFEDGRPWPREDWELASTYRHLIEKQDFAYQWGPLIFAHNTPFLYTYWATKWWRVQETAYLGERWISGYANHDTLRRGIQASPYKERINTRLGESFKQIIDKAYDNPATTLLCNNFLPGVPMDFLNASYHAPWSFMRNTDTHWALKVVAEEHNFLHWQVSDIQFQNSRNFQCIKRYGFKKLEDLKLFLDMLSHYIEATNYDISLLAQLLNKSYDRLANKVFTETNLAAFARAWMQDIYAYCNVTAHAFSLDHNRTAFNHASRTFRHRHPWLSKALTDEDHFDYLKPANGTILYYGLRTAPDEKEQVLFMANMEGAPLKFVPGDLPIPNMTEEHWQLALVTPKTHAEAADETICLEQAQGALFIRKKQC